jgi:hypothetical protein
MKKSLLVLLMMAATRSEIEGMIGDTDGGAGGGHVYMTGLAV